MSANSHRRAGKRVAGHAHGLSVGWSKLFGERWVSQPCFPIGLTCMRRDD
jgi:hypothetical protein